MRNAPAITERREFISENMIVTVPASSPMDARLGARARPRYVMHIAQTRVQWTTAPVLDDLFADSTSRATRLYRL